MLSNLPDYRDFYLKCKNSVPLAKTCSIGFHRYTDSSCNCIFISFYFFSLGCVPQFNLLKNTEHSLWVPHYCCPNTAVNVIFLGGLCFSWCTSSQYFAERSNVQTQLDYTSKLGFWKRQKYGSVHFCFHVEEVFFFFKEFV